MASGTTRSVKKWEICELAFAARRAYDNPFREVSLEALFDDGVEGHAVGGFYDGSHAGRDIWKIRFAPPREGRWSFRTVSNDEGLDGQRGDFACTAAASRGGLETSRRFPNWFFRADGQPQFIVNDGWAPHPGFKNVSEHGELTFDYPSEEEYQTYLRVLGDHRVNLVLDFNQSYARQGRISDPSFRWPWKVVDGAQNRIDRDRFNLLFYQRLDRMLAFAKERGIFYGLELLYDKAAWDAFDWAYHPWNAKNGGWIEDKDGDGRGWAEIFDLGDETNRDLHHEVPRVHHCTDFGLLERVLRHGSRDREHGPRARSSLSLNGSPCGGTSSRAGTRTAGCWPSATRANASGW